jgi:hypothetical protein
VAGDIEQRKALERAVATHERLDECVGRMREYRFGAAILNEPAGAQDRDARAHLERLVDVVRDEDDRLAELVQDAQELVLQRGRASDSELVQMNRP